MAFRWMTAFYVLCSVVVSCCFPMDPLPMLVGFSLSVDSVKARDPWLCEA